MRPSSKSRSRNKHSSRRSVGNVINRVFDSSGPEGKVRGTPQQIIDKYVMLSRDASLSGDRVAAENFAQHAEHYTRLIGEAQREMQERREAQDSGQGQQGQPRGDDEDGAREQRRSGPPDASRAAEAEEAAQPTASETGTAGAEAPEPVHEAPVDRSADEVIDLSGDGEPDSGLVETPESKPPARRRASRSRSAASRAAE